MQLTQMHSKQLFKLQHLLLQQHLPKEKRLLRKKKRNLRKHQNPSMSQMKTWDLDFLTKISSTVLCNIMGRDFFLSNAKANVAWHKNHFRTGPFVCDVIQDSGRGNGI